MRAPPTPDGHGLRHDTLVRIRRFRAPRRRQSFRTYRSLSLSLPPLMPVSVFTGKQGYYKYNIVLVLSPNVAEEARPLALD